MNILNYYKYAQLATAAYVRLGGSPRDGATFARLASSREQERLPSSIGQALFDPNVAVSGVDQWTILRYYGGDVPASIDPIASADKTGFAATLFQQVTQQGTEKVLAIRGTEPTADGFVDLIGAGMGQIGLLGLALTQVVSMINLIQRMRAGIGEATVQIRINASAIPLSGDSLAVAGIPPMYLSFSNYVAPGIGGISAGEKIKVTGHSLGGQLAYMAAQLLPDVVDAEVPVFNSAGYNPTTANFLLLGGGWGGALFAAAKNYLIQEFGAASLGVAPLANQLATSALAQVAKSLRGTGATLGTPNILNLVAEDLVPGDDGNLVSSLVTGADRLPAPINIPIEPNSHVIEPLMDSLALHALLYTLNSTLTFADTEKLLLAASNKLTASEERLTEDLFKLFLKNQTFLNGTEQLGISDGTSAVWIGKGTLAARDEFHDAVLRIGRAIKDKGYQLDSLVGTSAAGLTSIAQGSEALAYRYALKALNPFAIVGDNSLYAIHNQKGELDLYDPVAKTGSLTEAWLTDRAAFLALKNAANTADMTSIIRPEFGVGNRSQYVDLATGYSVTLSEVELPTGSASARQLVFGGDHGEVLNGRSKSDALYGGGGSDYLIGRLDNDYLEGGAGMDVYEYNGRTSVLGSPNNDGNDTILDTDGKGVLRYVFSDSGLAGIGAKSTSTIIRDASNRVSGTQWNSADGKFSYQRVQNDLIVTINGDAGGQITLKDFKEGNFGIYLFDDQRTAPQTTTEILGDKQYLEFTGQLPQLKGPGGAPLTYGALNFVGPNLFRAYEQFAFGAPIPEEWLNPVPVSDYVLHHTSVNGNITTEFYALPAILAFVYNTADDLGNIRTTEDDNPDHEDQLYGSTGNDHILAGGGNDNIDALRGGDNVIDAGEGRDVVFAGGGNDVIEGGDDGAVLLGSLLVYGGDMLNGGAGDDELYGDARISLSTAINNGETAAATNAIGDFLSGGAGNDWLVSGAADDALFGGDGDDILVGGAGNDSLFGDRNHTASSAAWTISRQTTGSATFGFVYTPVFSGLDLITDGAGGNDAIYAGAGDDWAFGGKGDDFIDGGSGKDVLFGDEGADVLIGGTGDDVLISKSELNFYQFPKPLDFRQKRVLL